MLKHAHNILDEIKCLTGCRVLLQVAGYMWLLVSLGAPLPFPPEVMCRIENLH